MDRVRTGLHGFGCAVGQDSVVVPVAGLITSPFGRRFCLSGRLVVAAVLFCLAPVTPVFLMQFPSVAGAFDHLPVVGCEKPDTLPSGIPHMFGGAGDDVLTGTDGSDMLCGLGGVKIALKAVQAMTGLKVVVMTLKVVRVMMCCSMVLKCMAAKVMIT